LRRRPVISLGAAEPPSPSGRHSNPRYLVRRLRRKLPKATIVAGYWTLKADETEEQNAVTATGADLVASSLQRAVEQIIDAVQAGTGGELNAEI
jgi:hypothetical protein